MMEYDAFISYSHAVDSKLAPAIQESLQQFAKPWRKLRAVRVFRDKSSLSSTPGLWPSIQKALKTSRYFILLASPDAAKSEWVQKEVECWLEDDPQASRLLLVLTSGNIEWDDATGDFDWQKTNALPEVLKGRYVSEPKWEDVIKIKHKDQISRSNVDVARVIAALAATIRGIPMDTLFGADVREFKKQMFLLTAGIVSITVLTVGILFFALRSGADNKRAKAATLLSVVKKEQTLDIELATCLALGVDTLAPSPQSYEIFKECYDQLPDHVANLDDSNRPLTGMFSRDGKIFAAGFFDGTIKVWETRTWRCVFTAKQKSSVSMIACDENGTMLASSDKQGLICLWSVKERKAVWNQRSALPVAAMDFTPDGRRLLVLDAKGQDQKPEYFSGRVLDVATGRQLMACNSPQPFAGGFFINGGTSVVTGSTDGSVRVWDAESGNLHKTLLPPSGQSVDAISSIVPSAKRDFFSAITWTKVHLWKSIDLSEIFQTSLSSQHVSVALQERPDSNILAVGCADGRVHLFRWWPTNPDRAVTETCEKLPFNTIKVAVNPVRDYFAAGNDHGIVKLWQYVSKPEFSARLSTSTTTNTTVLSFDPTGEYIVAGTEDGSLRVEKGWKSLRYRTITHQGTKQISAFAFHPSKPWVITVADSSDIEKRKPSRAEVILWDYSRNPARTSYTVVQDSIVRDVAINRDGTCFAIASGNRVSLWSMLNGSNLNTISCPSEVHSLAFARQHDQLAVGLANKIVRIFENGSVKLVQQVALPKQLTHLAFSTGDRYLGVLCSNGAVYLCDTKNWSAPPRLVSGFEGRKNIYTMAFHPEKDLLAIGTKKDVFLCDIVTGKKKGRLFAGDWVFNMAMSHDGNMLLTENGDDRAGIPESVPTLFDLSSQELRFTIPGLPLHTEPKFSYDDQLIGAMDFKGLILLNLSRKNLNNKAKVAVKARPLTEDEKKRYFAGLMPWSHVFMFIPLEHRTGILGYLSLCLLFAGILVSLASKPLTFRETLTIEMPFSSAHARLIVDRWNKDKRAKAAERQTKADFFMLLLYPVVFSLACVILSETVDGLMQSIGIGLSWAVLCCMPLDALENMLILKMLDGSTDKPIPQITTVAAIMKFILILAALLYIIVIKVLPYVHSQLIG